MKSFRSHFLFWYATMKTWLLCQFACLRFAWKEARTLLFATPIVQPPSPPQNWSIEINIRAIGATILPHVFNITCVEGEERYFEIYLNNINYFYVIKASLIVPESPSQPSHALTQFVAISLRLETSIDHVHRDVLLAQDVIVSTNAHAILQQNENGEDLDIYVLPKIIIATSTQYQMPWSSMPVFLNDTAFAKGK